MIYRNTTKGARAIHLTGGSHVLVDPGATADIAESKIKRLAPGLVRAANELPPVPADLAAALTQLDLDGDGIPGGSTAAPQTDDLKALRAAYEAKMGRRPFSGWPADELRRRMGDA